MILFLLLAISAIAIGIFASVFWRHKELMKLPGPSYFDLLAATFTTNLTPQDTFKRLINLNKRYGPVVKVWMNPLKAIVMVADPEFVKHLLSSNDHLNKSTFYELFHPFMRDSIVTVEANEWKMQRKVANPGFRGKTVENYVPTVEKFANKLIVALGKNVNTASFDVYPLLTMHALEIVCGTLLNLEKSLDLKTTAEYARAREDFFELFRERAGSLPKQNDFLFYFAGSYNKHQRSVKAMKDFSQKIVSAYLKQINKSDEHLINCLLGSYDLEDTRLRDNITIFVITGHESISNVMAFTLYELSKCKDIQQKIVEESNSVLGYKKDAEFSFAQLQQMKYLDCVLKETMRKYTPLPFFDRQTDEEIVIDGIRIPKGVDVSIMAHNIHHNEEYFPDPEKFLPDRFSSQNEAHVKPNTYLPFSLGPRDCIGKHFAKMVMKVILTKILRHYEIHEAVTTEKMELKIEFILKSTIGMPIRLTPRN